MQSGSVLHLLAFFVLCLRQSQGLQIRDVDALDDISSEFVKYASSRAALINGRRTVVLTYASGEGQYGELTANFLVNMRRLHVSNYALVCLDKEAVSLASTIREPCFDAMPALRHGAFNYSNPRHNVWALRMYLLPRLLSAGMGVLMTDMDAFWLKDPQKIVVGGDIASSVDNWPEFTQEQMGASACMGFIYFHASPAVVSFLAREVDSFFVGDDQVAINRALLHSSLSFPKGKVHMGPSSPAAVSSGPPQISSGWASGLQVRFLDHARFQRRCGLESPESAEQAYVRHCLSQGGVLPLLDKGWKWTTENSSWQSFEDWMHAVRNVSVQ